MNIRPPSIKKPLNFSFMFFRVKKTLSLYMQYRNTNIETTIPPYIPIESRRKTIPHISTKMTCIKKAGANEFKNFFLKSKLQALPSINEYKNGTIKRTSITILPFPVMNIRKLSLYLDQ